MKDLMLSWGPSNVEVGLLGLKEGIFLQHLDFWIRVQVSVRPFALLLPLLFQFAFLLLLCTHHMKCKHSFDLYSKQDNTPFVTFQTHLQSLKQVKVIQTNAKWCYHHTSLVAAAQKQVNYPQIHEKHFVLFCFLKSMHS